jgi:predicted Zn-dependent protease
VSASTTQYGAALEPASERALVDNVAEWDSLARAAQVIGAVASLSGSEGQGIRTDAWITRVGENVYWLVAESTRDARPSMRRRIGVLVRVSNGWPRVISDRAWSEFP